MSRHLCQAAAAWVLVAGAGSAHAQTVITREITTAPVETIIERGPAGTVITRRPLEMTVPQAPITLPAETIVTEPAAAIEQTDVTVGSARPAAIPAAPRRVAVRRAATVRARVATSTVRARVATAPRPPREQAPAARRIAPVPATVRVSAARTVRSGVRAAPVLSAVQRDAIYRTIVEDRPVPQAVIRERTVVAPPFGLPIFAPPPVVAPAVREEVVSERVIAPAPAPVVETVGSAPVAVGSAPADVDLVVGSRAPVTVPLYAVPPLLAVRIPAIRPYRYALVADRVFLVDPTGIVVEELAP